MKRMFPPFRQGLPRLGIHGYAATPANARCILRDSRFPGRIRRGLQTAQISSADLITGIYSLPPM